MPSTKLVTYVPSKERKLIDLAGQRFGRWTVLARAPGKGTARWSCQCDCGGAKVVDGPSLRRGLSTSCGCISRTHGGFGTRLYRIWANMLNRCRNPNVPAFKDYGGRGITVCADWHEFPAFKAWAEMNGYAADLTIERKDVNAGYSPNNCEWLPIRFQSANRRTVRRNAEGRAWCEIAKENGISTRLYNSRICKGWPDLKAATTPIRR